MEENSSRCDNSTTCDEVQEKVLIMEALTCNTTKVITKFQIYCVFHSYFGETVQNVVWSTFELIAHLL